MYDELVCTYSLSIFPTKIYLGTYTYYYEVLYHHHIAIIILQISYYIDPFCIA